MRKYLAVLFTFILGFSSSLGVSAQGQVAVEHFDVSNLENVDKIESDGLDRNYWDNKWANKSLSTTPSAVVVKKAAYGDDNWSGNADDDTFRPNAFTKRSELVVMVNRIIDRSNLEQETPSFTDVSKEFWGYEAIEAATEGFVPLEQ